MYVLTIIRLHFALKCSRKIVYLSFRNGKRYSWWLCAFGFLNLRIRIGSKTLSSNTLSFLHTYSCIAESFRSRYLLCECEQFFHVYHICTYSCQICFYEAFRMWTQNKVDFFVAAFNLNLQMMTKSCINLCFVFLYANSYKNKENNLDKGLLMNTRYRAQLNVSLLSRTIGRRAT